MYVEHPSLDLVRRPFSAQLIKKWLLICEDQYDAYIQNMGGGDISVMKAQLTTNFLFNAVIQAPSEFNPQKYSLVIGSLGFRHADGTTTGWRNGGMVEWRGGLRIMGWRNGGMTDWRNGGMATYRIYPWLPSTTTTPTPTPFNHNSGMVAKNNSSVLTSKLLLSRLAVIAHNSGGGRGEGGGDSRLRLLI